MGERAAEGIPGASAFVGLSPRDVLKTLTQVARQALRQPLLLLEQQAGFLHDLTRIVAGESQLAPEEGDKRFHDPTWTQNAFYRAWLQAYLAWRNSVNGFADRAGLDATNTARARFAVSLVTEALAPTNFLFGNPTALKRAIDSGGASLVRGFQNFLSDLATNGAMPSQVNKSAFQVSKNLALSPGAVVFRNNVQVRNSVPLHGDAGPDPLVCPTPG